MNTKIKELLGVMIFIILMVLGAIVYHGYQTGQQRMEEYRKQEKQDRERQLRLQDLQEQALRTYIADRANVNR